LKVDLLENTDADSFQPLLADHEQVLFGEISDIDTDLRVFNPECPVLPATIPD
jgi:hypothetical protein